MRTKAALLITLALLLTTATAPAQTTELQAPVTKTATFDGAPLDVSGLSGAFTIRLQVSKLTAGKAVLIQLQDVAAADFTTPNIAWAVQLVGEVQGNVTYTVRSYQLPSTVARVWGKTNGKFRLSLAAIEANASINYAAWVEQ